MLTIREPTMKKYLNAAVNGICESIRFDSSLSAPLAGMPFGKGAADCLAHFLSLAESLGFQTRNYDNYVGEAVFGEGEEEFAVLAHLDVVPAGSGWTKQPFGGIVEDGRIWGRGAMDDKGPAIAALYSMKALKDEGFVPRKKIKLIVGCNEECGWACIDHYKKVAHMPKTGFSPDANFPVIYAEKGILHVKMQFTVNPDLFSLFEGGERINMVCDRCKAVPLFPRDGERVAALALQIEDGALISKGKSAHGSTPEEGENAILPLLRYFNEDEGVKKAIACLFEDRFALKTLCDETGNLTLSPDMVAYERGILTFWCDIRYPATLSLSAVTEKLDLFGAPYETISHQSPLFNQKDGELVSALLSVYNEYAGTDLPPIAIGGGTYARALECGAAFGPEIEGEEVTIHQADEYITLDRVLMMLEIYKRALKRLTQ